MVSILNSRILSEITAFENKKNINKHEKFIIKDQKDDTIY